MNAMNEEDYMRAALEQARAAGAVDEVPVGAVVVCAGEIVGRQAEFLVDLTARRMVQEPLRHTEIAARHRHTRGPQRGR